MRHAAIVAAAVCGIGCEGPSKLDHLDQLHVTRAPVPTATPATPAAPPAGDQDEKMRHCPVTMPGVETKLTDVPDGVRFELHAADPTTLAELRRRGHYLADMTTGKVGRGQHGGGKGGGKMRNCPVVVKDTSIVATDIDGGVALVVAPKDASELAALRTESVARLARAPLPRAEVVREETSEGGEVRLFSAGLADVDGDGVAELVAGGVAKDANGKQSTIRVYRASGNNWEPLLEDGWHDGAYSLIRNVELADLDGDKRTEIVVTGKIGTTEAEAMARVSIMHVVDGKLETRAASDWRAGVYTHGYGLALGDLDGDTKLEIVSGGFQSDGADERGFVRVWKLDGDKLVQRAELVIDNKARTSMRVNDLAIGDVDGDGKREIVVAGRYGALHDKASKGQLDQRHEAGALLVVGLAGDKLAIRSEYAWEKATSLRLRTVAVADLDGKRGDELVVGGQYDADGKAALAVFQVVKGKLALVADASSTTEGVTGEVKDLVIASGRVLATGPIGSKPGRHGDLAAWRFDGKQLVQDASIVSRNGDETRVRSVVALPDGGVLTIGHAQNAGGGSTPGGTIVGQVLRWKI